MEVSKKLVVKSNIDGTILTTIPKGFIPSLHWYGPYYIAIITSVGKNPIKKFKFLFPDSAKSNSWRKFISWEKIGHECDKIAGYKINLLNGIVNA